MRQAQPESESWVHPDDLIDDRALASEDEDAFRLGDVVEEVVSLCTSVPVPATLALYGSWGSGKSSLANLLDLRFKHGKKIAFARFDAFKYAELPLRRHFLSHIASAFGITDKKFKQRLYESTKGATLRPRTGWWTLAVIILIAVLTIAALATLASVFVAVASTAKGSFRSHFADAWRASVPGVVLGIPILATLIGLVARFLTVDTTTEAPSSDEQFERLFEDLVTQIQSKTKCERVVIFIDELDRCSAKEVVSTLETLRTFLDVPPCILIVAADQQALERALTDAARQETPFNTTNPYYSAGSAYLDKIFQYQLPLPPILARRLSRFALDLIEERQGVWEQVPNRAELVSVLIPSHVHSPRRVKALLNSFALLFRLALRRAAERSIAGDVEARASEVAKLVCLKTEFPLFAADLELDARLPDIALRFSEGEEPDEVDLRKAFPGVSDEALARAGKYGRENLAVDEVIAQETAEGRSTTGVLGDKRTREVERSQAKQLIRYLEKTREITTPRRDLIYLESSGAAFDLPSELADQLERDAVDGQVNAVATEFNRLDAPEQQKAYRLLAWLVVEAPGIEARNVVRALFRALTSRKGDLAPIADDLLNALVKYNAGYELEGEDLQGALELALSDDRAAAQEMRSTVLARDEVVSDSALGHLILEHCPKLHEHDQRVGEVLAAAFGRGESVEAAEALRNVADSEVENLLETVDGEDPEVARGFGTFVSAVLQQRGELAIRALTKLVSADNSEAGDAARNLIELFRPVTEHNLASAIVTRAKTRPAAEWPSWLGPLDENVAKALDGMNEIIDAYVRSLWEARFNAETAPGPVDDDQFVAAARELGRLRPDATEEREQLDLLSDTPATSQGEFPNRRQQHAALWELVDAGAAGAHETASAILADLSDTLASNAPAHTAVDREEFVLGQMVRPFKEVRDASAVRDFAKAAENSAWLDEIDLQITRAWTACALQSLEPGTEPPLEQTTLEALVAAESEQTDDALAQWLISFQPAPGDAYVTLRPRVAGKRRLKDPLLTAVGEVATSWSPEDRAGLLAEMAPSYIKGQLADATVRAFELPGAEAAQAATILVENYKLASNEGRRRRMLALWELIRPATDSARRKLIERIYLPLLAEGKGAARIALRYFDLVRNLPPRVAQDRVRKAIQTAAAGDSELSKRADRLLQEAGWVKKRSLFGHRGSA
jgi:hypothetical protein